MVYYDVLYLRKAEKKSIYRVLPVWEKIRGLATNFPERG